MANAWQRLKGLFSGDTRASQSGQGLLTGISSWSTPPQRDAAAILRTYKRNPYFHSVARRVAEETASVPFQVLKVARNRQKSFVQARGAVGANLRRKAMARGEMGAVDNHPMLDVLADFNPALPGFDSRVAAQLCADFLGDAPMVRENDVQGRVLELWPIPPTWVAEMPGPGRPYYRAAKGSWNANIPEEGMVWGRVVDPENPYGRGTSYGAALGAELDVADFGAEFLRSYLHNGALPAGILSFEGADPSVMRAKKEEWNARFKGAHKAGQIDVTTGKASYTPITPTLQQLEMTAFRDASRRIVQEVYNVPPEVLGVLENSNRSTVDAAYYHLARLVVVPRMERWVSWLQPLLEEWGPGLLLSYENPVPEDEAAERAFRIAVPAVFTVNEHRASGGAAPLPGKDGEALYTPPAAAPAFPVGLAAGDPPWTKALPGRPVRKALVPNVLEALRPDRLSGEVVDVENEEFQRWAEAALKELGVSVSFDMRNPLVREALKRAGDRIVGITQTTADDLRRELQAGVDAGEGIRELTARVEDVFNHAERYRSERIARTETVGLSNAANLSAWHQSGVVDGKEWLSIDDGRSGERHHERMDGQRVGLSEAFRSPGGHAAQHPGGFGVAEEDINCRCAGVPQVNDPTKAKAMDAEQRKAMGEVVLKGRVGMEDALAAAFRRGFAKQREDVLAALRSQA